MRPFKAMKKGTDTEPPDGRSGKKRQKRARMDIYHRTNERARGFVSIGAQRQGGTGVRVGESTIGDSGKGEENARNNSAVLLPLLLTLLVLRCWRRRPSSGSQKTLTSEQPKGRQKKNKTDLSLSPVQFSTVSAWLHSALLSHHRGL